jgi:hypothetical protein
VGLGRRAEVMAGDTGMSSTGNGSVLPASDDAEQELGMYTAIATIVRSCRGGQYTTAEIHDLVVACAQREDGLEHIHVRPLSDRLELMLFIQSPDWRGAKVAADRISLAVIRNLPGWSLVGSLAAAAEDR